MSETTPLPDVGAPFIEGLRARKLMLQFDRRTGQAQFYPRPQSLYSEAGTEWRQASGRGSVFALTLSKVAPPPLAAAVPYLMALVQLDEGPRLMARIAAPADGVAIGQRVEVDWSHPDTASFPVFKTAA